MNINVTAIKNKYDAFNLDDARTNVASKDPIPVFMTMRLDKALLRPAQGYHGGDGTAQYRRALDPTVFQTNWSYMDHLVLPAAASEGRHRHPGIEEVYYVLNGDGEATVNGETAAIHKGDHCRRRRTGRSVGSQERDYSLDRSDLHWPCGRRGLPTASGPQ